MSPPAASAEQEYGSIFDGGGETALLDARRLVRAGELASRANPGDDDYQAFGAVFRAIAGQLDLVERWVEGGQQEVRTLRASQAREPAVVGADATGS